jgi:hypothetical protein
MKPKNIIKTLLLLVFFSLNSCSSDSKPQSNSSNLLVGKWYIYKNIEGGFTLIGSQICNQFPNCKTYEFKSNGTCIFTEYGYVNTYIYKIDADFIKFYNPQTEVLVKTNRIILLTDKELGMDQTDEVNYFKKT